MQDSGRNYEGEKMGKKQIVKKNQMKVKQAEEKLIFYFFLFQYYSLQPLDDQQQDITVGNPFPEPPSSTEQLTSKPLPFFPNTLPFTHSGSTREQLLLTWASHDFLVLLVLQDAGGHSIATLTQTSPSTRSHSEQAPGSLPATPIRWFVTQLTSQHWGS